MTPVMTEEMPWSEGLIAAALARQTFASKCLVILPNCYFTGFECDLLVVTMDMRVIDVEVKISRADLKADARKDKWWQRDTRWLPHGVERGPSVARQWPPRVWKHYYALPRDIWKPELAESLASSASGVLLLHRHQPARAGLVVRCERRAKPDRQAQKIGDRHALGLARLASLRMWDAIESLREAVPCG